MQWKTIILDNNNWALATAAHKNVLHWTIKDRPWYVVRTYGFENLPEVYPVQLKSLNWKDASVNHSSTPEREVQIASLLMHARIKVFTELHMRLVASRENLGIDDTHETIVQLHSYLASIKLIEGGFQADSAVVFQNRIKLLGDLEEIKNKIINLGLEARSKEDFDAVRNEMERMFFTNILL